STTNRRVAPPPFVPLPALVAMHAQDVTPQHQPIAQRVELERRTSQAQLERSVFVVVIGLMFENANTVHRERVAERLEPCPGPRADREAGDAAQPAESVLHASEPG